VRIRIDYATRYAYDAPARATQVLRLTPRPHEGQHVGPWRIDCDSDVRLTPGEDAFGNIVHRLETEGRTRSLSVQVRGEAETWDTGGVVRGAVEKLPLEVYLRDTPLTAAGPDLTAFAREVAAKAGSDRIEQLHALNAAIFGAITFETGATDASSTAEEAFRLGRGVCQDTAQVFISAARVLGAPARYVSGHLLRTDTEDQEAAHAWAEAYVPDLGWVGFDPLNGISPTEHYLRVAIGLDYLGAAPVRGASWGGGRERMSVRLNVADAGGGQSQQQSQS
jgi:transglutaminase-like putative cysteine protease